MANKEIVRIPTMDGLRAVSVLFVIVSHSHIGVNGFFSLGNIGVRMFFVISSYLITGILFRDVLKNRFNLNRFYFKRVMRTFPAFYFFLAVLFIFLFFMGMLDWNQHWRAPFYLENYHPRSNWSHLQWFVGHSWSLAVEEQFYLLIAALFYFHNRSTITKRGVIKILLGILIVVPLIRLSYMRFDFIPVFLRGSTHRSFETVCDALAMGGIGYMLKEELERFFSHFYKWPFLLLALLGILFISFLNTSSLRELVGFAPRYFYNLFGIFSMHFFMLFILFYGMSKPSGNLVFKLLNTRPFISVGLLSYSIYLWQQPWLYRWDIPLMLKYFGIIGCSLFSYFLVEEPFLKWRDRVVKSKKLRKAAA